MITSVNLSPIPFQSSTDSTRLQMSSKQIQQSLTHPNCEIPFVIGNNYEYLTNNSTLGVYKAKDDGQVVFSNYDLLILHYKNFDTIDVRHIPPVKKAYANFGSQLRSHLHEGDKFNQGDILYEYDCFTNGIPTPGYNVFTAYMPWFGFNHEDGLVISENFAEKSKATLIDKIYIPIYEFTLLQPLYINQENSFNYFPAIDQSLHNDVLCSYLVPKKINKNQSIYNIKTDLVNILKSMNLSQLLNMSNTNIISNFNVKYEKSKLMHGKVSGIKIHKMQDKKLIDVNLDNQIRKMYSYYNAYLVDTYTDLSDKFQHDFCKNLMYRYFIYNDVDKDREKLNLRDVVYLLEFEITQYEKSNLGDKFTNLYAGKGVVSQILPDDLRPIGEYSNKPVDLIYNTFGVFSRMNYGQIINGMVAKTVQYYNDLIKNDQKNVKEYIHQLNENVIQHIDENYYRDVQNKIIKGLDNKTFCEKFLNNINENNLYIRSKAFVKLDTKTLSQHLRKTNETVIIKKETIEYLKDKCNLKFDFVVNKDIRCKNIFCAPIYIMKLYKLTSKTINARDFGPIESLTGQPTKGRAKQGGSKLGQMEIETIIAHGCDRTLKEFMTVKSDHNQEKKELTDQIIRNGEYNMKLDSTNSGKTKKIVDILLNFLKD